jgi:hypothetical protein
MTGCEHPLLRDTLTCPHCHATTFECVNDGELTNFRCLQCRHCWHWELNYMSAIDPVTCPGCAHLLECLADRDDRPYQSWRSVTSAAAGDGGA